VVDSSPDPACLEVARGFPWARLDRSAERLLPQAARNRGAHRSRGSLLVFTDPDVYAAPDWLERLVIAHRETGHPVVGALACHGRRALDRAIHLCKFSKWLPGGVPRPVDMSPSANMLMPRDLFTAVGGFPEEAMQGDALLSWRLRERDATLWFEPAAIVEHHHLESPGSYLRERYRRGRELAALRLAWAGGSRSYALQRLLVTALGLRLVSNLGLVARHAARAGQLRSFCLLAPFVAAGFAANLAGEARTYAASSLAAAGASLRLKGRSSVSS
jgi:GT2 family glycosyltransferase